MIKWVFKIFLHAQKGFKKFLRLPILNFAAKQYLLAKGADILGEFKSNGFPYAFIQKGAALKIGPKFRMNNFYDANIIGRQQKCIFYVTGELYINENVAMSSTAIVCMDSIRIGRNVRIGGNTVIYDTNFHSLHHSERLADYEDPKYIKTAPVIIEDNVFIGAHCIILKGIHIGKNSVIGSGSVVSKDIPKNEVWAGNPVRFVKRL